MEVLVDSSIWIDYFTNGEPRKLDLLIDEGIIVTNELILSELIPFLKVKSQDELIDLLYSIEKLSLNINWSQIAEYQYKCIQNGINGVGIPDLIILQNVIQNNCKIYTRDKHFELMENLFNIKLIE